MKDYYFFDMVEDLIIIAHLRRWAFKTLFLVALLVIIVDSRTGWSRH